MWFNLITLFALTFSLSVGQGEIINDDNKKRILIVPFDAFAFQSKIDIPIIISSNHLNSSNEIYITYNKQIAKTLSESSLQYSFLTLPDSEIKNLRMQVPVVFKESPTSHYGVDLTKLYQEGLITQLLHDFSADYILFLCRYEINNRLFSSSRSFDGSTFVQWSLHNIDYELYNSEKQLIALADSYILSPRRPTDTTHLTHGVRADGMTDSYKKLTEDIISKIEKYEGEPVYKIKK